MLVIFRTEEGEASCRCLVEVEWTLIASGEAGEGTFRIPRSSFASVRPFISWDGGSQVYLPSQGGCGPWYGVVSGVDNAGPWVEIQAVQPWAILGQRFVPTLSNVMASSPANIWAIAVDKALGSLAGYPLVGLSTAARTAPVVEYRFDGQDLMSVANDLMALSDGEPVALTSPHNGCVYLEWQGPTGRPTHWPYLFVADSSHLFNVEMEPLTLSQLSEVRTRSPEGRELRVWYSDSARRGWPAQAMLSIEGGMVDASASAINELNRGIASSVVVRGKVPPSLTHTTGPTISLYQVKEGDYIHLLLRERGFTGSTVTVRILRRALSSTGGMTLEMMVIYDPDLPVLTQQYVALGGKKRSHRSAGRSRQRPFRELQDVRRLAFKLLMRRIRQ